MDEEIITLEQAIELIKQSLHDEKKDEIFCNEIITNAQNPKEISILTDIANDERKHYQILMHLYNKFTGITLPHITPFPDGYLDMSFKEQLEKALFRKLELVKIYRRIMGAMPDNTSYVLLMSIVTDELRHVDLYNFLINQQ